MTCAATSAKGNLIDELESALAHGNVAQRVTTLTRITDLFVMRAADYSDDQIALFDDVFALLVTTIEASSLAHLSHRLAPIPNAPPRAVRTLAFDERLEVAAPVLTQSERLDDATLVENARTKGQGHLLAISKRRTLSPALTDVLVERGDRQVVHSTAANPGAAFSEIGLTRLIDRCDGDDKLACVVGARDNIPRHHFLKLLARASLSVRKKLETLNPEAAREIGQAVEAATAQTQFDTGHDSSVCRNARSYVQALYDTGQLDEAQVGAFVRDRKFEETTAALALMAGLSVELAESMMLESRSEGVLIIAKVSNLSWSTVEAILRLRGVLGGLTAQDLELCKASYVRLKLTTAQQVLRFHRMREKTRAAADAGYGPA